MSNCNPCPIMRPLPKCMGVLTIGDTTFNNTDVFVYIKNHTTSILTRFETTTSGTGLVTLDLTNMYQIEGHDYELWVTLDTATNMDERINITIDAVIYTCVAITFEALYDSNDALITGQAQTLKAA